MENRWEVPMEKYIGNHLKQNHNFKLPCSSLVQEITSPLMLRNKKNIWEYTDWTLPLLFQENICFQKLLIANINKIAEHFPVWLSTSSGFIFLSFGCYRINPLSIVYWTNGFPQQKYLNQAKLGGIINMLFFSYST